MNSINILKGVILLITFAASTAPANLPSRSHHSCLERGFKGGHFDIDLFYNSNIVLHSHKYNDKYNCSSLDLINGDQLEKWWAEIAINFDEVQISFMNAENVPGYYTIEDSRLTWKGFTGNGELGTIIVNPIELNVFKLDFNNLMNFRGTSPEAVKKDTRNRDHAMSVNIYDMSGNLIYQLAVYEHKFPQTASSGSFDGSVCEK